METTDVFRQQVATVTNRPMRLGFIVNRNIDADTLHSVLQYNSSVWNGELNLFAPTDGNELTNDWWRMLQHYDPDIIIWVGEISDQLRNRVYEWVLPFYHSEWNDGLLEQCSRGQDQHSMSVWPLIREHYEHKGKVNTRGSHVYLPKIGNTKYKTFFEIAYGVYPPPIPPNDASFADAFKELLGAKQVACTPATLDEYLRILDDFAHKTTPIRFTRHLTKFVPLDYFTPRHFSLLPMVCWMMYFFTMLYIGGIATYQ